MPLVIPAGYALASLRGTVVGDGEEVVATVGFQLSTGASVAMANDIFDAWGSTLDSLSSTDWTFQGVDLKEGPTATGPTYQSSDPPISGLVSQTGAPINTSILVRKVTALGGRKGRGRMYTVGQAYQSVYGMSGEIDNTHLAALDTAWFSIQGLWQAIAGIDDVVLLHSDATPPTEITGLNPQKRMATQRRRLRP